RSPQRLERRAQRFFAIVVLAQLQRRVGEHIPVHRAQHFDELRVRMLAVRRRYSNHYYRLANERAVGDEPVERVLQRARHSVRVLGAADDYAVRRTEQIAKPAYDFRRFGGIEIGVEMWQVAETFPYFDVHAAQHRGVRGARAQAPRNADDLHFFFAAAGVASPRSSSSGCTLGSCPENARYISAGSSLPPRDSTMSRKRWPFARVMP